MIRLTVLALILLLVSSCTFRKLEQDVSVLAQMRPIKGEIIDSTAGNAPLIMLYLQKDSGATTLTTFSIHPQPENFNGLVKAGNNRLFLFKDLNKDFQYQPGEPAMESESITVSLTDTSTLAVQLLLTSRDTLSFTGIPAIPLSPKDEATTPMWHKGTLITNGDSLFSDEATRLSYWEPISFVNQFKGGIYFNQPYDSTKIPVLFVHGAAGTPLDLKTLAASIDTTRYQAWFYYYPSGMPLYICVEILHRLINSLQVTHDFRSMIVVAHSMGGLVTRSYLTTRLNQASLTVPLYITLSTPWNGHAGAQAGIDMAPAVVPSWIDMAPGSPFLTHLFDRPLPSSMQHHLLFGVKGECSRYTGTNDGSVSIASQLATPAQQAATKIYGYDESHMSILSAPEVLLLVNQLLAEQTLP